MISSYARIQDIFERLSEEPHRASEVPYFYIGRDGDAEEVGLGRGPSGTYRLWVRLPVGRSMPRLGVGSILETEWVSHSDLGSGRATYLQVSCNEPRLNRTFLSLTAEMLDEVRGTSQPVLDGLLTVIDSWHEILRSRNKMLSRQEAIGLFGELTILRRFARLDPRKALDVWRGAENYRHDFNATNSLEVKTYTGYGEPRIRVHGAYQLEPPLGHRLYLVTLKVDENESGESLPGLVDALADLGVSRGTVLRKLDRTMENLEALSYRFVVEEIRLFEVGADFPGIRPSRLEPDALRGVDDLSYSLGLDHCTGTLPVEELEGVLKCL